MSKTFAGQQKTYPLSLRPLLRAFADINAKTPHLDDEKLAAAFRKWGCGNTLTTHTKFQAAAHEAGHVAVYALARVPLIKAKIFQDLTVPGNWLGHALHLDLLPPLVLIHEADVFSQLARFTMSGPIAEALIGNGNEMASFPELLRASAFSARAAELDGGCWLEMWTVNVLATVATVEQSAPNIKSLASLLERRSEIEPQQRKVKRILEAIVGVGHGKVLLSCKGQALARRLVEDVPCASALLLGSAL